MREVDLLPHEIVQELDRFVVGQGSIKRALAIAFRNRWRRRQLTCSDQDTLLPKNLLVVGKSGSGKTLTVSAAAKILGVPFVKVDATSYSETGYAGKDVSSMVVDLYHAAEQLVRQQLMTDRNIDLTKKVENAIISQLVGKKASKEQRAVVRNNYRAGKLDDALVNIHVERPHRPGVPSSYIPHLQTMKVARAKVHLTRSFTASALDPTEVQEIALEWISNYGVIFVDEIDKTCPLPGSSAKDFRQGVQRGLLSLVEGIQVNIPSVGMIDTSQIMFIAAGAFHYAKPTDLMPEFQGRFPVVVKLKAPTRDEMIRIVDGIEHSLVKSYRLLLSADDVTLEFSDDAIEAIVDTAIELNAKENSDIGIRRLNGVLEKVMEPYLYNSQDYRGKVLRITKEITEKALCEE